LVVLALVGAAGAAAAQPPKMPSGPPPGQADQAPGKWWQDAKWRAALGLSADQVARIEEIFVAAGPKMRDGYRQLEPLEEQLSKMISGDGITEVEVLRQLDRIEAIRTELSKERTLMVFRIRRVLTPEQRAKLAEMQSRHSDRGRGRTPVPQRH
jgi:Spy/CpxP family protein refolding chaperone